MAMIKCPECSAEVSDTAFDCPKCATQLRKPKRTFFGQIIKWLFILFNLLMLVWIIAGLSGGSDAVNNASSDAEATGAAIGTGIGVFFLLIVWGFGDLILGLFFLFTRPSK
jgi:hypothetical protein